MKRITIILLLVLAALSGAAQGNVLLPAKITIEADKTASATFKYDGHNRIITVTEVMGDDTLRMDVFYNSSNRIENIQVNGDGCIYFTYTGSTATKNVEACGIVSTLSPADETTYTFNKQGLLEKESADNSYYNLYRYNKNNELTAIEIYKNDKHRYTYSIDFKNPFTNVAGSYYTISQWTNSIFAFLVRKSRVLDTTVIEKTVQNNPQGFPTQVAFTISDSAMDKHLATVKVDIEYVK